MWIPKFVRDRKKGVDSAIPTQVVSNEEFVPRPQNKQQRQVEYLINTWAEEKSKKLGMDRRAFMASSLGTATCFLAINTVYKTNCFAVDDKETMEPGPYEEKYPKGEYFVIDVQSHFTNGQAIGFRNSQLIKGMSFNLKDDAASYSFPNFVKEMYFDSETSMVVISGVPTKENQFDRNGQPLEGPQRSNGILPSWLMAARKKDINELAGGQRALCQGNCAPNHYWDSKTNSQDQKALFEQMEREVKLYGIDSWKWYCHTDPGRSGNGFTLDDEKMTYPFYEQSKKLGMKLFSVHKGYRYQSRTLGHLANPEDVERPALDHPDLSFVIYHSAIEHGTTEPEFQAPGYFNPTTGDFNWHNVLMDIKRRNPQLTNVYPELGSAFNALVVAHPEMCQHLIGKNVQVYGSDHVIWGTDCLWWGSPQWAIEAFQRFQITDEMCEKFGYKKLSKEDKANILGRNAARLYGINPDEKRKTIPKDGLSKLKTAYLEQGGMRENAAYGWVRDDVNA